MLTSVLARILEGPRVLDIYDYYGYPRTFNMSNSTSSHLELSNDPFGCCYGYIIRDMFTRSRRNPRNGTLVLTAPARGQQAVLEGGWPASSKRKPNKPWQSRPRSFSGNRETTRGRRTAEGLHKAFIRITVYTGSRTVLLTDGTSPCLLRLFCHTKL